MSYLRELTDAELDVVGGGAEAVFGPEPAPIRGLGSNPLLVVLEDIIRLIEGVGGKTPAGPRRA
jgi:hypothetical protein